MLCSKPRWRNRSAVLPLTSPPEWNARHCRCNRGKTCECCVTWQRAGSRTSKFYLLYVVAALSFQSIELYTVLVSSNNILALCKSRCKSPSHRAPRPYLGSSTNTIDARVFLYTHKGFMLGWIELAHNERVSIFQCWPASFTSSGVLGMVSDGPLLWPKFLFSR